MAGRSTTIVLLITLMGAEVFVQTPDTTNRTLPWNIFLFGIPLVLIGCLLANQRWALMAAVMYGTVGLALDISTIMQSLAKPDVLQAVWVMSGITGALSFLVIVFGGKGFLTIDGASSPPESPHPNPPSSFSS